MEFKDPTAEIASIPIRYRGAFARWKKIKNTPIKTRAWAYVLKKGENECWPFIGKDFANKGYGLITLSGSGTGRKRVRWLAHRLIWTVENGPIPKGFFICHHCDNPPCCNPKHLFAGTPADNTRDMHEKGRNKNPKGEEMHSAVLTEDQVIRIRKMHIPYVITFSMIAKMFGVTTGCVGNIVARRKWKHVP